MKKRKEAAEVSFGTHLRGFFSCMCKCQHNDYQKDLAMLMEKLQDMEDLIEIIARQVARWAKVDPGEEGKKV